MSYPGSKGADGVWQRIIGQMPPHDVYIEPFAGSAQIFFRKKPAAGNVLIDVAAGSIASLNATVRTVAPKPALVDVKLGDALTLLPKLAKEIDSRVATVIYCDPPYLLSTRQGRFHYANEFSDLQHLQLLALLKRLKAYVLISGYPNEIYSSKLKSWRCQIYTTRTRGRTVQECLWMNFPEPTQLHDWRFAGRDFRERCALKRLATRWLARLDEMPERKRGYLLNALSSHTTNGATVRNATNGDGAPGGHQRQNGRCSIAL